MGVVAQIPSGGACNETGKSASSIPSGYTNINAH